MLEISHPMVFQNITITDFNKPENEFQPFTQSIVIKTVKKGKKEN